MTHTMTTTSISYELAKRMGLKGRALSDIYFGSLLHDLGKIGIPVEILEFPGKLSPSGHADYAHPCGAYRPDPGP